MARKFVFDGCDLSEVNDNFIELYAFMAFVLTVVGNGLFEVITLTSATYNYLNDGAAFFGVTDVDFNPSAQDVTVTSLVAGFDGQRIRGYNAGAYNLIFNVEDTGQTPANRIRGSGTQLAMIPGDSFWLSYRAGSVNRWTVG